MLTCVVETFSAQRIASVDNPQAYASYTAMQRTSLSEGEANHYLGDLLLHIGRDSDAERYFKQAIALDPGFIPAYAALGRSTSISDVTRKRRSICRKATPRQQNYMIHYFYAYVLEPRRSRSGRADKRILDRDAAVMREQLLRAIKLAPNYAPAYYLLALVDLVTDERLDEALEMAQSARQLAPSNQAIRCCWHEIYLRRADTGAARQILEPLTRDSISQYEMKPKICSSL